MAELPGKSREHREMGYLMAAKVVQKTRLLSLGKGHFPKYREERNTLTCLFLFPPTSHWCLPVTGSSQKPTGRSSWEMLFAGVSPPITQNGTKKGQENNLRPKWHMNGAGISQCQFYSISSTQHFLTLLSAPIAKT